MKTNIFPPSKAELRETTAAPAHTMTKTSVNCGPMLPDTSSFPPTQEKFYSKKIFNKGNLKNSEATL